MNTEEVREAIRSEYCRRRECNPNYSLRAYARQLGISSGALSELIQGKRSIGLKMYELLKAQLGQFPSTSSSLTDDALRLLRDDEYALVKDWYHFAMQDLLRTRLCERTPTALAKRLGITTAEAVGALTRMARLGLVRQVKERWYATKNAVTTTQDIPSAALRYAHRQDLRNAERSLDEVDVMMRDFSAITLCFSPKRLQEAKARIECFRRAFWQEFDESGGSEVYQLSLYMFPLTKQKEARHDEKVN